MGVSKHDFFHSTPKILQAYDKAYIFRIQEKDRQNWQLGQYIMSAIGSCFSKNTKYIEKPFLADIHLTEEERKERELKKFIDNLQSLKTAFDANRKDDNK